MLQRVLQDGSGLETAHPATIPSYFTASVQSASGKSDWKYRFFDLLFIAFSAPVILPTIAVLLLIIKTDDPNAPVFYRQTRYGKNRVPFRILKFRTMIPGADQMKDDLLAESEDKGPGFKLENDPRVTRPGRMLRKLYLDELPQFWNVFVGDMSIVGPRANSTHPDQLEPWQQQRLSVRPGITGTWQTMLNKPRDFAERCRIDLEYIANKSLLGDFVIICRTAVAVLFRTGC